MNVSNFLLIFGLVMTLSFDVSTSKSNEFISVPECTKIANMLKFPQDVYKVLWSQTFGTHTWKHNANT